MARRASTEGNGPKKKKLKSSHSDNSELINRDVLQAPEIVSGMEIDFPRGGGSPLDPHKSSLSEGYSLGGDAGIAAQKKNKIKTHGKPTSQTQKSGKPPDANGKNDSIRVEHLNYKRVVSGMKMLVRVVAITPLSLVVSLPNQLYGHIPATQISPLLTRRLEALDLKFENDASEVDEMGLDDPVPNLSKLFSVGQFLQATVTSVHSSKTREAFRTRDWLEKSSSRVTLSLSPMLFNSSLEAGSIKPGMILPACIRSIEDHGIAFDFGIQGVTGFVATEDAKLAKLNLTDGGESLLGLVYTVTVVSKTADRRTILLSLQRQMIAQAHLQEIEHVNELLPGTLVSGVVFSSGSGLVVRMFGSIEGTIDYYHMNSKPGEAPPKVGSSVRTRILYNIRSPDASRYALSMRQHVTSLDERFSFDSVHSIGEILKDIPIVRVERDWGLVVKVSDNCQGFAHISQVSDEHVPELSDSTSRFKIGSRHQARITGFHSLDMLFQLSLRSSVLGQKFLHVGDVSVGERVTGIVKKLTPSALFVSISANADGIIWSRHFADISLRHPEKRFKEKNKIQCKVLSVEPENGRVLLTAKRTIVESTLPIIASFEDAKVGMSTHGVVCKVMDKGILVEFFSHLKAFLPLSQISDTSMSRNSTLQESFPIGKPIKVTVIKVQEAEQRITISTRNDIVVADNKSIELLYIGQVVTGEIIQISTTDITFSLQATGVRARLLRTDRQVRDPAISFVIEIGQVVPGLIVASKNHVEGLVTVKMKPNITSMTFENVLPDQRVLGRVIGSSRKGALVRLSANLTGLLHATDVHDDYAQCKAFPPINTSLEAVILSKDNSRRQVSLSTRQSRLDPSIPATSVRDPEISTIASLSVGRQVRGFIKSITDHGLFVSIGRDIDARIQIRELFDEYVKEWQPHFKQGQLLSGRILSINSNSGHIEVTLRSANALSHVTTRTLKDLAIGEKVACRIKRIETFGIFLQINDSSVSGLCHKTEISDRQDENPASYLLSFREGDIVTAIILSIEQDRQRISFGLKPSYFLEEDFHSSPRVSSSHHMDETEDDDANEDNENEDNSMSDDDGELSTSAKGIDLYDTNFTPSQATQPLNLTSGFDWKSLPVADDKSDVGAREADLEEVTGKERGTKRLVEHDFTADMHDKAPQSTSDFERLLLGSPDSSYIWIRYASFHLQLSDLEKARQVTRRALQTISFREEKEKFNVWIAILNMENTFGTSESLSKAFVEAAKANDAKTIHLRMCSIYERSNKLEEAESLFSKSRKSFSKSCKVWTETASFLFKRGKSSEARALLSQSLVALETRKHAKVITKFGQLEYNVGDPERGRTIFEGLIESHPKRFDLWSIYIDMEASKHDIIRARNLFRRLLSSKLTVYKAKAFFKRWLALERRLGDSEGETMVKEEAVAWNKLYNSN